MEKAQVELELPASARQIAAITYILAKRKLNYDMINEIVSYAIWDPYRY